MSYFIHSLFWTYFVRSFYGFDCCSTLLCISACIYCIVHPFMHAFIYSFVHSSIHSFVYLRSLVVFMHSFVQSFIHSFTVRTPKPFNFLTIIITTITTIMNNCLIFDLRWQCVVWYFVVRPSADSDDVSIISQRYCSLLPPLIHFSCSRIIFFHPLFL